MSFDKKYYLISSYILIFLITIFIKNLSLLFIFKYKFNLFSVIEKSLKYNAMKKFLNTNLEIYTKQSQAKLLYNSTRISDVINYFESVYNIFNEIIFFLFIIISLFLYFSFKVVLVLSLFVIFVLLFAKYSNLKSFTYGKIRRINETNYVSIINLIFNSYREIKIYNFQKFIFDNLNNVLEKSTSTIKKIRVLSILPKLYLEFFSILILSIFIS